MLHMRAAFILFATVGFGGCATTSIVSEANYLADAGIAFSDAAQQVLPYTSERYLEWQNDSLLEELPDLEHCAVEEISSAPTAEAECKEPDIELLGTCIGLIESFDFAQCTQQKRVASFDQLTAHAKALGSYFQSLKTLSKYESATSAANAADRAIGRLNGLSDALEKTIEITPEQRTAWSALAGLVGDSIKAARLRSRLKADAAAIGRAIDIQDAVLATSADLLGGLDEAARREEYLRNVRTPYLTNAIENPSHWRAARLASLSPSPEVTQMKSMASASAQLRDVWEDILSGSGSPEAAQRVFDDLSQALEVLTAVRRASENGD